MKKVVVTYTSYMKQKAKENIISEIVLCDNRLESECLNDIDLQAAKKSIARSVGRCSYFFAG